jgi:hypothetical protein
MTTENKKPLGRRWHFPESYCFSILFNIRSASSAASGDAEYATSFNSILDEWNSSRLVEFAAAALCFVAAVMVSSRRPVCVEDLSALDEMKVNGRHGSCERREELGEGASNAWQ